eukprot:COSAG01_NODE_11469_length_1928_cov_1.777474_4_plen_104_part_00
MVADEACFSTSAPDRYRGTVASVLTVHGAAAAARSGSHAPRRRAVGPGNDEPWHVARVDRRALQTNLFRPPLVAGNSTRPARAGGIRTNLCKDPVASAAAYRL